VALPGPGWWAATWLLPAFLLCVGTLALATVLPLATAAGLLGGLWLLAALAVGAVAPLVHVALFGPAAQFGYLAAAVVAIAFLALRSAPCGAQARTSGGESSWPTPAARSWSWPARSYSSATSRPPVTGYLRIRQVVLLTVPVARMVPWAPAAAAVVLSLLACLPALAGAAAPASQVWALRIAAFLLGAGACFALVGPLAPVSATPTPRWLRQWLRTVIALTPAVAVWLALFSLAAYSVPGHRLPFAELAAEASVCGLTGVAGTAVAARRGHSLTTALAGPAAQGGLVAATLFLAGDHSPWLLPTPAAPPTLHDRWIAAVPVPILVLGVANLEPWRRTILSMFPAR